MREMHKESSETESDEAALSRFVEHGFRVTTSGRIGRERLSDESGVLRARDVVEVLHRRLDVRVPHPLLNAADVSDADDARAEGVAEVMEAERAQAGSSKGSTVTL
jgi:hypothetical protein